MTTKQMNYLRMVMVRRGIMNKNTAIWTGNAKITTVKQLVEQIFAQILADAGIQESDITGTTEAKDSAWATAVIIALHVCRGMRSYAEDISDWNLYNMMHYKKSDLDRGEMQEILDRMNIIAAQSALVPVANLASFNITAANLTTLNSAITALTSAVPQHGMAQAAKKTSTANIKKNFTLLRLNGRKMNNLVDTLELTQAGFVSTYRNSCVIIDYGKGQMAEEVHMMPDEHVAIFKNKFLPDDTFTIRNHSKLAKIKVFLGDSTDLPTAGGIEIEAENELKLSIPDAFKMPFGHYLIVMNEAHLDDAHVTIVLAHGKSHSGAPEPMLANPTAAS